MTNFKRLFKYFFFLIFVSGCYKDDFLFSYTVPEIQSSAAEFDCNRQYLNAHDFNTGRRLWNTQQATSIDGRTKIVVNTYIATTHIINHISDGKSVNHLSVTVDPDEVLVGGGASVFLYNADDFIWSNSFYNDYLPYYGKWWQDNYSSNKSVPAFLYSSYPVDNKSFNTWAADSKGQYNGLENNHHLKVTAVGMKVYYDGILIPSAKLKENMDISSKESSLGNSNAQGTGLFPVLSKWVPLAVGVKSCWTEDGDGWILSTISIEEDNTKQEGCIASGIVIREQFSQKYSKATSILNCLSLKNINPNDNSKPLFKHTFTKMFTGNNQNPDNRNGLTQRFRVSPTDFSQLVLSAFGGEDFAPYLYLGICSLTPLSYGDCWESGAELVTKNRLSEIVGNQFSKRPHLSLLEITPN
jgi:hypothetical protein